MSIIELEEKAGSSSDAKLMGVFTQFAELLTQLRLKELPDNMIDAINLEITEINAASLTGKEFRKLIKKKQAKIITKLEKELKIVPKEHYRKMWLALGISIFGIPIGAAFASSHQGNPAFYAIGIPFGLLIGLAIGTSLDKKASNEGRQLDIII